MKILGTFRSLNGKMPVTTIYIQGLLKACNIHLTSIFRKEDWGKKRWRVPPAAEWTGAAYWPSEQIHPAGCVGPLSMDSTLLSLLPRKSILGLMLSDVSQTEKDKYSMLSLTCVWRNPQSGAGVTPRAAWQEQGGLQEAELTHPFHVKLNLVSIWNGYILTQLLERGLHHWALY